MILIVGLGNPGKKFEKTRHNIGFTVINQFRKNRDRSIFSDFEFSKKFKAEISEGIFNGEKMLLANPQTFMNLSGKAVKDLVGFYKIELPGLIVIHDDIDIPLGKIRISVGRGSAGQKGVESIIKELKTKNFIRFRIGIQPGAGKPKNAESFVLKKFSREEEKIVNEVIEKTCEAIEFFLSKGLEKAMNEFNA